MSNPMINEHRPELLASGAFNPFIAHDSSARVQMMGSHLSQALPVQGCTVRNIQTGIEREFGRCTRSIFMPVNAEIIESIQKFPPVFGAGGISSNPTTVVIYMDQDTRVIDVLEFDTYHSMHQHFGFNYVFTREANKLNPGNFVPAGTVLGHSPTIDEMGNYRIGLETQCAYMSLPGIIEDGIIVSESYTKRLTTKCIEKRWTSFGKSWYPLNLYGTDDNYKPFPDIGDRIRPDGLIFALRQMRGEDDIMLAPVEMSVKALQRVNYFFDRREYGQPGAIVTNISVRHDAKNNGVGPTPEGMDVQAKRYYQAESHFHQNILDAHRRLTIRHGDHLVISPQFQRLLREARMYLPCSSRGKSTQMYQLQPLDDWRVDLTYEYDFVPTIGSKLTGLHGDKGVICQIWPDENMPVDEWGNRAELIAAASSTIDRMNIGRPIEHYVNGSLQAVHARVVEIIDEQGKAGVAQAFAMLRDLYGMISPKMLALLESPQYKGSPEYHVEKVYKHGIKIWAPIDNPRQWLPIVRDLMANYPARIGHVKFRGMSGVESVSVDKIAIASAYMLLLEKTGSDWSGVASARHQHFGLPAKLSKQDKYSLPSRANPVRIFGESEVRLGAATCGGDLIAEILEMSNSPATHRNVCYNILMAPQPSNIDRVVDRSVVPMGSNRACVNVAHQLQCAGIEFFYVDNLDEGEIYPADPMDLLREKGVEGFTGEDDEGDNEDDDESGDSDDTEESATEETEEAE